ALIWVADTTVTPLTATPAPDTLTAVTPVNPVPVMVTGETLVPRAPDAGLTEVTVGPSTVNVTALLVPPGVTTVTFLAVAAAPAVIVSVVVSWVPAAFTVRVPAVTPAPDTLTAVAPVKPAPEMVTGTAVPAWPLLGVIEFSPMPLPVRLTVSVSPGFVVTESVPGCGPVAVGANRTLKVQLAPPARV